MEEQNQPGNVIDPSDSLAITPSVPSTDSLQQPQTTQTLRTGVEPDKNVKSKQPRRLLLLLIIAMVVLGSGGAFAYFGMVVPNRPENVLRSMLTNTVSSKTMQSEGKIYIELEDFSTTIDFTSAADVSNLSEPRVSATFDADILIAKLNLELVLFDRDAYFKLSGLDGVLDLFSGQLGASDELSGTIDTVLNELLGKWFVINESLINQSGITLSESAEQDLSTIMTALTDHEILVAETRFDDEDVRGKSAFHYAIIFDEQAIKDAVASLQGKTLFGQTISAEDVEEMLSTFNVTNMKPLNVWVYKHNKRLARVAFKEEADGMKVETSTTFYAYDEPVTIEKPSKAKSILELSNIVQELMGEFPQPQDYDDVLPITDDSGSPLLTPATLGEIIFRR